MICGIDEVFYSWNSMNCFENLLLWVALTAKPQICVFALLFAEYVKFAELSVARLSLYSGVPVAVAFVFTLGSVKQSRRRQQQKPRKFAYLTIKKQYFCTLCTCIFHLLTFWRRSRSFCDVKFAVLWTTWAYDDKCSILSSYVPSAGFNLIPR